jgi:hypothetical protein
MRDMRTYAEAAKTHARLSRDLVQSRHNDMFSLIYTRIRYAMYACNMQHSKTLTFAHE